MMVGIRLNESEYRAAYEAARESGLSLAAWVRMRVFGAVVEAIPPRKAV